MKGEKIGEELTRADSKNCMRLDRKSLILDNVHTRYIHTHTNNQTERYIQIEIDRQTDAYTCNYIYIYPYADLYEDMNEENVYDVMCASLIESREAKKREGRSSMHTYISASIYLSIFLHRCMFVVLLALLSSQIFPAAALLTPRGHFISSHITIDTLRLNLLLLPLLSSSALKTVICYGEERKRTNRKINEEDILHIQTRVLAVHATTHVLKLEILLKRERKKERSRQTDSFLISLSTDTPP